MNTLSDRIPQAGLEFLLSRVLSQERQRCGMGRGARPRGADVDKDAGDGKCESSPSVVPHVARNVHFPARQDTAAPETGHDQN